MTGSGPPEYLTDPVSAYARDEAHPWVEAFLADQAPGNPPVIPDIGAGDEMFAYLVDQAHGSRDRALVEYFRTGLMAATTLGRVLRHGLADHPGPVRLLDFAAGWGRVSRFLTRELPGASITVSDISAAGVAFQRDVLGLPGFVSVRDPAELEPPHPFEAVVVPSLFTHLPRETFGRWLAVLAGLLAPGGLLVVSTHGPTALPGGRTLPADGFLYDTWSEIGTLSPEEYGSTFVSREFMAARLAEIAPEAAWHHVPRGLWHVQDLYLLARDGGAEKWEGFQHDGGPDGDVFALSSGGARRLALAGWAVNHPPHGRRLTVEVHRSGRLAATVPVEEVRPEVAERFDDPAYAPSGWAVTVEAGERPLRPTDLLLVKAVSDRGREMVLWLGTLEALRARLEIRNLRRRLAAAEHELGRADAFLTDNARRLEGLEATLARTRSSPFWRLRTHLVENPVGRLVRRLLRRPP